MEVDFLSLEGQQNLTFGLADDMFQALMEDGVNTPIRNHVQDHLRRSKLICEMILVQEPCHTNALYFLGLLHSY